jgi:alpha-beta hydrolase superfamily lysophospholipase
MTDQRDVGSAITDHEDVGPVKIKRKRHRRWPWVLLTIFLLIVVAAWLAVGAVADSFIANNGKNALPIGPCPYTNCGIVNYSAGLQAWYGANPDKPVIIIVHGYGANRSDHSQVGVQLQHLGYAVMSLDLGYEGSKVHYGGGVREASNVAAAANYAFTRSHGQPIYVIGYSAGGTSSILAAAQSTHIRAVVADSAPVSFIHIATDRLGAPTWVFSAAPLLYSFFSSNASLGSLSSLPSTYSTPTLVIQGTADKTVDFSNGAAVAKLTNGQLWTISGGTHTSAAATCPTQYVGQINQFFKSAGNNTSSSFTVNQSC